MHIAIIGGGPAALFIFRKLVHSQLTDIEFSIFEKSSVLGAGMPYSTEGAGTEHVTNVSANEIPELPQSIMKWMDNRPHDLLAQYEIDPHRFHEYKVFPRLLFGQYLSDQFQQVIREAKKRKIITTIHLDTIVSDIEDEPIDKRVVVQTPASTFRFDRVIICTGHNWPSNTEGKILGYFDSPYPPSKFTEIMNSPVAIRGSSLTAVDAVRTLARLHGEFYTAPDGRLLYELSKSNPAFRLVMHSIGGLLPAVRFHLEDAQLSKDSVLSDNEIRTYMAENGGFIPLDILFEKHFLEPIRSEDPEFFETIRSMNMEQFVDHVMSFREAIEPFNLLKAEYREAEQSIRRKESVYWKEMLAVLSFAMNYPAKHLSAEDMLRLQQKLKPLISIVIAFVPQQSCHELIALYDAGILSLVSVDKASHVHPQEEGGIVYFYTDDAGVEQNDRYSYFVDAIGQPALSIADFPFQTLVQQGAVTRARLKFRSAEEALLLLKQGNRQITVDAAGYYYLEVQGIAINDAFQVIDQYGAFNDRLYNMAVPYMGGFNPDYSGLDFCEASSVRIARSIETTEAQRPLPTAIERA